MSIETFLIRLIGTDVDKLGKRLDQIIISQGSIMAAIDDLKAAVLKLQTSTSNELKAVQATIAASQSNNNGSVSATDAESIVASINAVTATLDTETASLAAQVAPAQPPSTVATPTPTPAV